MSEIELRIIHCFTEYQFYGLFLHLILWKFLTVYSQKIIHSFHGLQVWNST